MLKSRPISFFVIKTLLIFVLLALPFSIYDITYGRFYRVVCKALFGKIKETGFVKFSPTNKPEKSISKSEISNNDSRTEWLIRP